MWKRTVFHIAGTLAVLLAAAFASQRTTQSEYIGIDFVQFRLPGQHVQQGGDPRVWAADVRNSILKSAWQNVQTEPTDSRSKLFHAVNFRHDRSWETYSSPFLYAVFALNYGEEQGNWGTKAESGNRKAGWGLRSGMMES